MKYEEAKKIINLILKHKNIVVLNGGIVECLVVSNNHKRLLISMFKAYASPLFKYNESIDLELAIQSVLGFNKVVFINSNGIITEIGTNLEYGFDDFITKKIYDIIYNS